MRSDGRVHLVGAGPGDPELMTVKARRLLGEADIVLHDSLVGDGVLEAVSDDCDIVAVGKEPGGDRTPQAEINCSMVEHARAGDDVVRLKGGDPFVFGRGGEEMQHLAAHGVEFEVVPGVSSAVAGSAVAGIPATHREHASSFTMVTGHEDPSKDESALDWSALAANVDAGGTLVVLMGVGRLPDNAEALVEAGVPRDTPVAVVERATMEGSRAVTATLDDVAAVARRRDVEPPAVTVVGEVVEVRDDVVEWMVESGAAAAVPPKNVDSVEEAGAVYHG